MLLLRFGNKSLYCGCYQQGGQRIDGQLRNFGASNADLGKMLDKLEHLAQLCFRAWACQLHCPAQIALRRVHISQRWQIGNNEVNRGPLEFIQRVLTILKLDYFKAPLTQRIATIWRMDTESSTLITFRILLSFQTSTSFDLFAAAD